ncbi:EamA family transporter [Aquamicrobium sp. LC103]|uniref:EamA family transporter n=1 Tax=Aquamicrobium sp. LC103 TaxID=1120658 RepID=UPI00063E87D0|nr:EamA family transporter [Aquamicrobium sp. LC103]TKT80400.1 EamA family transporter [Aquamicrobium sp. LC103]
MSATVFLAVLAAAAMHASWNAMIKVRLDRFASISLMSFAMGLVVLPLVPFVAFPKGETWLWIALSMVFHTGYKFFLTKAYETGDLAQSYPLARGTAPLLTTIGGAVLLGELPGGVAVLGILLLCAGTFLMSFRGGGINGLSRRAVGFALLTSVFVASYTLTDGSGARSAASATSYAVWLFLLDAVWSIIFCVWLRGARVIRVMLPEWKSGLAAGLLGAVAYWIAMWAMTKAPIASVAALRETSILFAMLLSVAALGETMTRWRIAAALLIVGGVIALRLG